MYIYFVSYEQLDWDTKPLHELGIFSSKKEAFILLRKLLNNKWEELINQEEDIFYSIKVYKGKNRVYVDISGEENSFIDEEWRFRIVRYKLNEVLEDELIRSS